MQMISLFFLDELLKVNFQDSSNKNQPLFSNKANLQRFVI